MSRYIDADELLKEASKDGAYGYVSAEQIANFPAAEVQEIKHSRWEVKSEVIGGSRKYYIGCSICGYEYEKSVNYCPKCGAAMVKE